MSLSGAGIFWNGSWLTPCLLSATEQWTDGEQSWGRMAGGLCLHVTSVATAFLSPEAAWTGACHGVGAAPRGQSYCSISIVTSGEPYQ